MNSRLSPVWAAILSLVLAVPAVAGQGIVTIYGVTSNGGSPPTYTCNVSSSSGITVGDHVMAKTTSAGATGVWLVTAKPSATSVTLQDSLTQETGTAFGAPLANVTNGLAYGTPESGTTMIPDGASWWAAAARRNYVVLAEAAPSGAALTRVDDTNVTLTLGGTPGTALLQATSLTVGWTGTLAASRGGTGAASLTLGLDGAFGSTRGSILYRGASGWVILAPGTSGYALVSNGAGADPSYQAIAIPTFAQVLGAGADGNAVDQTNLGSLTLAASEGINTPGGLTITTGSSTGVLLAQGGASEGLIFEGTGTNGARLRVTGDPATLLVRTGDDSAAGALSADTLTSSTSMTSPAFILGSPDTSGVRLDIESGRIAVREGDDSNYNSMNLFKALATDSLVIGAETTSGIRLDLAGSTFAVREGDDSAYGPMIALQMFATDSFILGSADTSGIRLDLSGGTLELREGDDSNYANLIGNSIVSVSARGTTNLAVGTVDTNGIRLDLETGTLAVREGDDSAYGPVAALDLSLSGTSLNCNGTASITGYKLSTSANTNDSALAVTQAGRIQTNEGAVGAVNLTLPTATATTGYVYEAAVQANQYLRFTAATGDTIRDGATVSAAAGYIRSTTVGSTIRLYCINATEWIVLSKTGTWTVDS